MCGGLTVRGSAGRGIKKLKKDGLVLIKPSVTHSKARTRLAKEAKSKGRHTGYGKRRGTREARLPSKLLWLRRLRVLRRLLKKYREQNKQLTITRLIPVCSRVVSEATAGNQPKLTNVTVRTLVGETKSERERVEAEDLAIVQSAKRANAEDLDEEREF